MAWNRPLAFPLAAIVLTLGAAAPLAAQQLPIISANDNRVTSGALKDGVLTLRLEMRKGIWHPESDDGEAIPVYAFGEAGKPLQVPGPAIRVRVMGSAPPSAKARSIRALASGPPVRASRTATSRVPPGPTGISRVISVPSNWTPVRRSKEPFAMPAKAV